MTLRCQINQQSKKIRILCKTYPFTTVFYMAVAEKLSTQECRMSNVEFSVSENKAEIFTIQEILNQFQRKIDDNENAIKAIALNSTYVTYADICNTNVSGNDPLKPSIGRQNDHMIRESRLVTEPKAPPPPKMSFSMSPTKKEKHIKMKESVPVKPQIPTDQLRMPDIRPSRSNSIEINDTEDDVFEQPKYVQRRAQRLERRIRQVLTGTAVEGSLKGAPPPSRDLFLYRVDKTTVADDVKSYLTQNNIHYVNVYQTSNAESKFKSFKITVPFNVVGKLMKADMWPEGIRIRKFIQPKKDGS